MGGGRAIWIFQAVRGWAALAIIAGGVWAYSGSSSGPFVFDDGPSILGNETIRHLGSIGAVLSPPAGGQTVTGRPVLNLSLAINHALGGSSVKGYHRLNLAIHLCAGLVLFGSCGARLQGAGNGRRAAGGGDAAGLPEREGTLLAGAIALLWTVHPLQTESVTYVVQRAESLAGLFYFLAVYGFIRGTERAGGQDTAAAATVGTLRTVGEAASSRRAGAIGS